MDNPIYDKLSTTYGIQIHDIPSYNEAFRDYLRCIHKMMTIILMISFAIVAQRIIHWIKTGEGLFE